MTDRKLPVIYVVTQLDGTPIADAHGRGVFVTHTRADEALTPFEPAVPRCKTCKTWYPTNQHGRTWGICKRDGEGMKPDDYCSRHSELSKRDEKRKEG